MAAPRTIEELKNDLKAINRGKSIKIRIDCKADGKNYFFLEYNKNGKRSREYLRLQFFGVPRYRRNDQENYKKVRAIQERKETELHQNKYNYKLHNQKLELSYLDFFEELTLNRKRPDKSWRNTLSHLKKFLKGKDISFSHVDARFCERFKDYLLDNVNNNTAHTYFGKIKASLNKAIERDIISANPAQRFHISKSEVKREFLTEEELQKLANTPCFSEQTKRAFLFACFTGLRISDIRQLTWDNIEDGYLSFTQMKTKGVERLKLHTTALEILELQKADTSTIGKLFNLVQERYSNKHLKSWALEAGIKKKVTWHVARHTFATLNIGAGTDLYTVAKLLGHKDIKVTQIYAKIVDEQRDKAIDHLPSIDIS